MSGCLKDLGSATKEKKTIYQNDPTEQKSEEKNLAVTESGYQFKKSNKIFCELCHIQCNGNKSFKIHQKGRKHLKKLIDSEKITVVVNKNDRKIKAKPQKDETESRYMKNRLADPECKNIESMASCSSHNNCKHKLIQKNRHISPLNKDMDFPNMIHNQYDRRRANHSDFPPSSYMRNDGTYYSNRPYQNHPSWNSYPPPVNNSFFHIPNDRYQFSPIYNKANRPYYHRNLGSRYFVDNRNPLSFETLNAESFSSNEKNRSQHKNSDTANEAESSFHSECPSSRNNKLDDSTKNVTEASTAVTSRESSKSLREISPLIKSVLKKKSLSASLASSPHNDKTQKDDNQVSEPDVATKQQKIKDWTNNLLESNDGQISRLIHPSNYKDKAAVSQLITNLSKSKRKEKLSRFKLRSNSMCSSGTNDEDGNDTHEQSKVDYLVTSESEFTSFRNFSDTNLNDQNSPQTESAENSLDKSTESCHSEIDSDSPSDKNRKSTSKIQFNTIENEASCKPKVLKKPEVAKKPELNLSSGPDENEISKSNYQIITIDPKSKKYLKAKKSSKMNKFSDMFQETGKQPKRKSNSSNANNKKQRLSDISLQITGQDTTKEQDLLSDSSGERSKYNIFEKVKDVEMPEISPVKSELRDATEKTVTEVPTSSSNPPPENTNVGFSVDTLINLFASGDVVIKDEFSDPLIDAIQSIDPNILMNACSLQSTSNSTTSSSAVQGYSTPILKLPNNSTASCSSSNQTPTSSSPIPKLSGNSTTSCTWSSAVQYNSTPVQKLSSSSEAASSSSQASAGLTTHNEMEQEKQNCLSPLIFGATITDNDASSVASNIHNSADAASTSLTFQAEESNCASPMSFDRSEHNVYEVDDIEFMPKNKSEYTPRLKILVKQLQQISSEEKTVKKNLEEARSKITEYQLLLSEWKHKKEQLQDDEEKLIKKRTDIIETMQIAVKALNGNTSSPDKGMQPSEKVTQSSPVFTVSPLEYTSNETEKSSTEKATNSPLAADAEIVIIPVKKEKPEVIVIEEEDDEVNQSKEFELVSDIEEYDGTSFYEIKDLIAHKTVVNNILVFEDCLYTSSNDYTAKRFKIKSPQETVTYNHTAKNVTEVVVEKVQSEALVFTSCANKLLSIFIASNGTKIKTYFEPCAIMSICKGWGRFFAGLADGAINVYNWKYEESEMVKAEHPASRIATAHQGRLHVLIILTSNGNISVRDAETGLLIRYIKGFVKLPSWLTVYNDLAYLSSSDKTLTVLDIMTGRAEKKLYVSTHTTGLAVYEDFVFTISYTGYVNCYNKEKMSDKKLYYGAGKCGLTCICVHRDWVFTGNRKGDISVFKFDPSGGMTCQFGQCCCTFGLFEDLEFHVETDHLMKKKNMQRCNWGMCKYPFHADWTVKERMKHMNQHISDKRPMSNM